MVVNTQNPAYLPDSSASFISALEQFALPVVAIDTSDARRLAQSFKAAYGEGVELASELEVVPLVEGERWQGKAETLLANSELEWLIPVVLTLVAFSGPQAKGTNSEPFRKRLEIFREARLCWVPILEAGLFRKGEVVVKPTTPAIWIDKEKVLLVSDDDLNHAILPLREAHRRPRFSAPIFRVFRPSSLI